MSIREGDTTTPHRLSRSLLVGVLLVPACFVALAQVFIFLFTWDDECDGGDVSDGPQPGSDQARMCDAWSGNIEVLYWIGPGLTFAAAVLVGVSWVRGRVHGVWVLVSVALLVFSPLLVFKYLTMPNDLADEQTKHEGSHDVAGHR